MSFVYILFICLVRFQLKPSAHLHFKNENDNNNNNKQYKTSPPLQHASSFTGTGLGDMCFFTVDTPSSPMSML